MQILAYDALIVGGRVAGAATALLLARAGARVLVIDWAERGSDTMSTHALMRGGVMQLARWGLLDALRIAGTPPIRRTTFHYGDEAIPIDLRPDTLVDALVAPRRTALDLLVADAAAAAGAEIRYRTAFRDLVRDATGRVTGAVLAAPDGSVHKIRARLVIGADGRRSTVARRLGAETLVGSRHMASSTYAYVAGLEDTGTHWHYREGLATGRIPTNDGLHCMFVSVPNARYAAERRLITSEAGMRYLLAESDPALADAAVTFAEAPVGFAGQPGHIRQSHGPGWALVGDAGYFKDPATAHGITDALRDAEILALAVLEGGEAALARYQEVRNVLSRDLFNVTDEIAGFGWTLPELKAMHLRLNAAMKQEQAWIAETFAAPRAAA